MNGRYNRNRIYVDKDEQAIVKNTKIFLGGAGIGSVIAECALRFGFENITIVDCDRVELSNLNRQNYVESDLGKYKAEALAERLLAINSNAKITYNNCFIDKDNVRKLIEGHDIAVNALDFQSDIPFVFDDICKEFGVPVLHPYNFGWGGFLTIVKPDSMQLSCMSDDSQGFELRMAEYVIKYGNYWNDPQKWLSDVVHEYKKEEKEAPPQLSIASWIAAGYCVNAMFHLATGKDVKVFPKFYLSSIHNDRN